MVTGRGGVTLYKVTREDGRSMHGGTGRWTPGRWRSVSGPLVPCRNGLHLCRPQDLVHWLGPVIWEAEADGEVVEAEDKVVARRARVLRRVEAWDDRAARLFAAACAEDALPFADPAQRPVLEGAIAAARAFAEGRATEADLSAARSAAESAAESAAWSAARSSARSAAWSAAWSAARSAARSAAWSAARSSAWSAARSSAWSAAESAAESAARSAARSAAWSSARERQAERLLSMLGIGR